MSERKLNIALLSFLFVYFLFNISHSFASKIVASNLINVSPNDRIISSSGCGLPPLYLSPCYGASVQNPSYALVENGSFARLFASPGYLVGLGVYDGEIELGFTNELPANTVSYVRIDADETLLGSLLGGNLGELLAETVGSLALGNQEITIQAKNASGTVVLERSSADGFNANQFRMVTDENGYYYLRIQPDQAYQRIAINNHSGALAGLGTEYSLDVYHAFYYDPEDNCDAIPKFTSFDGSGISLSALSLNDPISSIEGAIDGDFENTYSEMSLGVLSALGASSEQIFYFESPIEPGKNILINIATNGSLVDLGLFNYIEFIAYSEGAEVSSVLAADLLDLDILGLLESGEFFQFPISSPTHSIDQVHIKMSSLVSLGAVNDVLEISGMFVAPEIPDLDDENIDNEYVVCEGSSLSIGPELQTGEEYNWYLDWEGDIFLGKANSMEIPETQLPGTYTYYVRSSFSSCNFESLPSQFTVIVQEQSTPEIISITPSGEAVIDDDGYYVYQEGIDPVILNPEISAINSDIDYHWYFDENQSDPIVDGMERDGVSYLIDNAGKISMSGLGFTDATSPYVYYVNYTIEDVCPAQDPKVISLNSILKILHLQLESFHLNYQNGGGIFVTWSLSGMEEDHQVLIEKSKVDLNWETVYKSSFGDQETGQFQDLYPWEGYNFFRIKVVDELGEEVFTSSVESLKVSLKGDELIQAYPNHFDHQIQIKSNSKLKLGKTIFQIYSGNGILVKEGELIWGSGGRSLPITGLSTLPNGPYILHLRNQEISETIHLIK